VRNPRVALGDNGGGSDWVRAPPRVPRRKWSRSVAQAFRLATCWWPTVAGQRRTRTGFPWDTSWVSPGGDASPYTCGRGAKNARDVAVVTTARLGAQASTRPSPASLRKNGDTAAHHHGGAH